MRNSILRLALMLAIVLVAGAGAFVAPRYAMAAGEVASVTVKSLSSGFQTFTAAGNPNAVLVTPGTIVEIFIHSSDTSKVNSAHITDGGVLNKGQELDTQIIWGWNAGEFDLVVTPQFNWTDAEAPIRIHILSTPMVLTATPATIKAGQSTTLAVANVPMDSTSRGVQRLYPFVPASDTSEAFVSMKDQPYTSAGIYHPRVDAQVPSDNGSPWPVAASASATVVVRYADPVVISLSNNKPKVGEELEAILVGADYLGPNTDIIWCWQLDENPTHTQCYNTAQAFRNGQQNSPNSFHWTYSSATPAGQHWPISVSLTLGDGVHTYELASASNSVQVQPLPVSPTPSVVAIPDQTWTKSVTGTLQLFVTNPPANPGDIAVIVTAPGYSAFNAWAATNAEVNHTKLPDGRVRLDVLLSFPTVGQKSIGVQLDYAQGGSFQHAPLQTINVTVTQPKPTLNLNIPGRMNASGQNEVGTGTGMKIVVSLEGLDRMPSAQYALLICGLPNAANAACFNLTAAGPQDHVMVVNKGNTVVYVIDFKFTDRGGVHPVYAQLDVVDSGSWQAAFVVTQTQHVLVGNSFLLLPLITL